MPKHMYPKTALDSLFEINCVMCDYVTDSLLTQIKKRHPRIKLVNYYSEEITEDYY